MKSCVSVPAHVTRLSSQTENARNMMSNTSAKMYFFPFLYITLIGTADIEDRQMNKLLWHPLISRFLSYALRNFVHSLIGL